MAIALCAGVLASCAARSRNPGRSPWRRPGRCDSSACAPLGHVGQVDADRHRNGVNVNLKTRHVTLKDATVRNSPFVAGPDGSEPRAGEKG